jgi:hypothetical protein
VSESHKQRTRLDEPRRPAWRDPDPAEVGQQQAAVAGSVLTADVDGDEVALQPRTGGVPDFSVLARGMADDLRQKRVVVPVVVHLAEIRCKYAGGLVADLAGETPLTRMARADVKDFVRQVASLDSLPLHQHAAKYTVHVGGDLLGAACALFAHREVDDIRQEARVDEQLAVLEIGSLDDQPRVSFWMKRRLPDSRPEPVPEGVLSALPAFPVLVEVVIPQRPHDPSADPVRLAGEAMDEVEDFL